MTSCPRLLKRPPQAALRAGCSPDLLEKQLERARQRSERLSRLCQWAEAGLPVEKPRLQSRSPLGECLGELVADLDGRQAPPPEEAASGRPARKRTPGAGSFTPPERKPGSSAEPGKPAKPHAPSLEDRRSDRPPSGAPTPHRPAGAVKSDRALLERLAGPPALRAVSPPNRKVAARPRSAPPLPRKPGSPAPRRAAPVKDGGRAWAQGAAARLRKTLGGGSLPSAQLISSSDRSPAGEAASPGNLEAQWGWPLDGETIPGGELDLLRSGAGRKAPTGAESRQAPREALEKLDKAPEKSRGDAFNPSQSPDGGRSARPDGGPQTAAPAAGPAEAAAGTNGGGPQEDQNGGSPAGLPHDPGESLAGPTPRFAPPQLAPTLPSLRPVQRNQTALTPAATFAAERSARREARETEPEDLDELARKLRRILEEEARRHGIDV